MKKNKIKNAKAPVNPKPESKYILIFCLLFLFLAVSELKLNFGFPDPRVKGILFLTGLLIVPGYLLYRLLLCFSKNENIYTILPVSFVFSLLLFMPFGLAGYFLKLTLSVVASLYLAAAIGLGMFNFLRPQKKTGLTVEPEFRVSAWFILLPLLTAYLGLHFGNWISGDFINHMTNIRKLVEMPEITFTNYTLKGLPWPLYGYNIWHLFLSLASYLSHTDPIVVWIFSAVVLVPIKVCAFYSASRKIFDSEKIAGLSTIIYVFSEALMSYDKNCFRSEQWYWTESAYPSHVARDIIFPVILCFIFSYIKEPLKKYLWLLAFLGAALALTHFYYSLILFGLTSCFLVMIFIFSREKSFCVLKPVTAALLLGLPYSLWYSRLLTTPTVNPIYFPGNMAWMNNPLVLLAGKYPIFHPFKSLFANPVMTCATILAPFLFIRARARLFGLFLLGISMTLITTFYNPPALMLLKIFNPALDRIFRIVEIFPAYWILGFFWTELTGAKKSIYKFAGKWGVGTVLAVVSLIQTDRLGKIGMTSELWYKNYLQQTGFREFIRPALPPGAVVVIPQQFVWTWLTLMPYYSVIASWEAHLPPYYDQTERAAEQKRFLENRVDETSLEFLDRYNVDYIFAVPDKDFSPYQDKFVPVLSTQQWRIYRYKK